MAVRANPDNVGEPYHHEAPPPAHLTRGRRDGRREGHRSTEPALVGYLDGRPTRGDLQFHLDDSVH
jgi:hypothetical protein